MIKFLVILIISVIVLLFLSNYNKDNLTDNNVINKDTYIKKLNQENLGNNKNVKYMNFDVVKKSEYMINDFKTNFVDEF